MTTDIVVVTHLPKVGEVKELRWGVSQMIMDKNFKMKASKFVEILNALTEAGIIKYVIYDDIKNYGKIIKIKRLKI